MQEGISELIASALMLVGYAAASALFAGIGLFLELRSYGLLSSGETLVAAWMGALGLMMFVLAYLIVTDKAATAYGELQTQK